MAGTGRYLQPTAAYATASDFCRIFAEDMKDLYWLSFVLTADPGLAEQCFVAGLDDCHMGNGVFKEWARSWARRTIIKNAIRLVEPRSSFAPTPNLLSWAKDFGGHPAPAGHREISAVLDLDAFDRFAFVMSVLEGFSDRDCALLLGCVQSHVVAGRVRALQKLSEAISAAGNGPIGQPMGSAALLARA